MKTKLFTVLKTAADESSVLGVFTSRSAARAAIEADYRSFFAPEEPDVTDLEREGSNTYFSDGLEASWTIQSFLVAV